jgi:hypothetical protein
LMATEAEHELATTLGNSSFGGALAQQ